MNAEFKAPTACPNCFANMAPAFYIRSVKVERGKICTISLLKPVCGLASLLFYLLCLASFEGAHESFHIPSVAEIHSAINESDPCHRSLFHNDQKAGCHHPTHIRDFDHCSICDLAIHTEIAVNPSVPATGVDALVTVFIDPVIQNPISFTARSADRAPPVWVS